MWWLPDDSLRFLEPSEDSPGNFRSSLWLALATKCMGAVLVLLQETTGSAKGQRDLSQCPEDLQMRASTSRDRFFQKCLFDFNVEEIRPDRQQPHCVSPLLH